MGIGRTTAQDVVDEWIQSAGDKGSFVDIGGIGEHSNNERATWAVRCGYEKVAIADLEPFGHYLWDHFNNELSRIKLKKDIVKFENINVDDTLLEKKLGQWDFVHSTGILYHCPNPIWTLLNYKKIARKNLILNTVVAPEKIENADGTLFINSASALFLPSLVGQDRQILRTYYKEKFGWDLNELAPAIPVQHEAHMPHILENGSASYYPYWWLFTVSSFEAAARLLGMRIVERFTWRDHAHFVWLALD